MHKKKLHTRGIQVSGEDKALYAEVACGSFQIDDIKLIIYF